VLGDLDESHDHWADVGGVAGLVTGGEELHGGVFDLDELSWAAFSNETFEELNALINGFEETIVVTTADFMKGSFLGTSGVEAFELVVDTGLLVTVGAEDSLALGTCGGACLAFVVGTVTSELGIGDFGSAEALLFVTVNDLLGLEGVMFTLLVRDLLG